MVSLLSTDILVRYHCCRALNQCLVSIKQNVRHGEMEAFVIYIIVAVWFIRFE